MKSYPIVLAAAALSTPLLAQDTREMDAHVHGVSTFEMVTEGGIVEMHLTSPGMDIVGFEYEADTDADKDAVEAAIRVMLTPENIVTLPEAADCRLTEVLAHVQAGGHDHAHDEHAHDDHAHDDHAKAEKPDDHAHGHDHGHDHDKQQGKEQAAGHSEFHARYRFSCAHTEDLTTISFPFFETFANAQQIRAQFVTDAGAGSADIARNAAMLTLK